MKSNAQMLTRHVVIAAVAGAVAMLFVIGASAGMVQQRDKGATTVLQAPPAAEPRRDAPVVAEPSQEGQLVDEDPGCQQYANRAAEQYRLAAGRPECAVSTDARWNTDVRRHYRWCVRARDEQRDTEQRIRDEHLYACGAQRQ